MLESSLDQLMLQHSLNNFAIKLRSIARLGRGGVLVVSILAFYSDDPGSNPAGYLNFLYEKTKLTKKEAGVGPS